MHRRRRGTVVSFDEHRGLGLVRDDETGESFPFHCTAITDGSRRVDEGAAVAFVVRPGHLGRWEAGLVEKASENQAPD
ncbi:MAG: hypothetical protein KatS3mg008_0363 [Acidimicrobiales bacterium]|nr:MAG: hypothetical protein KatS3mg008_0363 [Acidimicrobiales bacterium]